MKAKKERVDKLLIDQGLAKSRTQAQALVMAGAVCLGDRLIEKPSETFDPTEKFRLKDGSQPKYVSRGGEKLEGALEEAGLLDLKGFKALDVGISTGGFTDCLLQHGVGQVFGIDVGHNQLDWKIRQDPRVKSYEGVNARDIPENLVTELVDIIVIDVSFISLTYVLPSALKFLKKGGAVLALIKPQFEVDKGQVGKGGIIKDPLLHDQVREKIKTFCLKQDLIIKKTFQSRIEGTDGNKEFFIFARSK